FINDPSTPDPRESTNSAKLLEFVKHSLTNIYGDIPLPFQDSGPHLWEALTPPGHPIDTQWTVPAAESTANSTAESSPNSSKIPPCYNPGARAGPGGRRPLSGRCHRAGIAHL
ncbi:MAG: hypothetical protein VCF07_08580, partial [Nitrospinota bacterium]